MDFPNFKMPKIERHQLIDAQNSLNNAYAIENEFAEIQRSMAKEKSARDAAIIRTAENTTALKEDVSSIRVELTTETAERKLADEQNMAYTKKQDFINRWFTIVAIAIALASLVFSCVKG